MAKSRTSLLQFSLFEQHRALSTPFWHAEAPLSEQAATFA